MKERTRRSSEETVDERLKKVRKSLCTQAPVRTRPGEGFSTRWTDSAGGGELRGGQLKRRSRRGVVGHRSEVRGFYRFVTTPGDPRTRETEEAKLF